MKQLIGVDVGSYTFDASAQTVTISGVTGNLNLEQILIITNVTDQIIIYNFADVAKGGSISSNVITLEHDTTSMSDTDRLQIWVDIVTSDGAKMPVNAHDGSGTALTSTLVGSDQSLDTNVTSSALPSGASTSANQTTIIGHVDGIEGLLTTIDSDTSTLAGTVSGGEQQVDIVASLPAGTNTIGKCKIQGDVSANVAEVDSSGRLLTSSLAVVPPASTEVVIEDFDNVTTTSDNEYTITNGKVLTISRFIGSAEADTTGGSVVELYEDPNGDKSVLNIIDVIFTGGNSFEHNLSQDFTGDGTRRIVLRRRRLSGGAVEVFGKWQGFET